MPRTGIEEINVYSGLACVDLRELANYRKLDLKRFENLMITQKSVALPFEDPVTHAVNAALPIVNRMSEEERHSIDLLLVCTESGLDFSKSMSTYIHEHLKLSPHCRHFEIKQACYSGTAGLQTAFAYCLSQFLPHARALVITTDISRFSLLEGHDEAAIDWDFAEPSGGAGAVAMLISHKPDVFELDVHARGLYSCEVMDTCRPTPDSEAGNAELSLMSYLDCCKKTFDAYQKIVQDVDYQRSFQYLAFHTPFGGMTKGAHRTMMRKLYKMPAHSIEDDFLQRVMPGLAFGQQTGNIMGGSLYLSLAAIIAHADIICPKRIGCFSYGSGCASEFFSGVCTPKSQEKIKAMRISEHIRQRYRLSIAAYLSVIDHKNIISFGTENITTDKHLLSQTRNRSHYSKLLYLNSIQDFHREYLWT